MTNRTDELEAKQAPKRKARRPRPARAMGLGSLAFDEMSPAAFKRLVTREGASAAAIGLYVTHGVLERHHGIGGRLFTNELLRWIEGRWEGTGRDNDLDYWIALGDYLAWLEGDLSRASLLARATWEYTELAATYVEGSLYAAALSAYHAAAPGPVEVAGLTAAEVAGLVKRAAGLEPLEGGRGPDKFYEDLIAGPRLLREHIAVLVAAHGVVKDAAALLGIPRLTAAAGEAMSYIEEKLAGPWESPEGLPAKWAAIFPRPEDITPGEPDKALEGPLVEGLGLYLTQDWRKWARAGMSLWDIAGRSTGVIDALRRARREYAALGVEEDE